MKVPFGYNVRSLFERKATTLMTVASIAFVVLVFVGVFSLAVGLEAAFEASGDPANVLVLRDGARSEMESYLGMDIFRGIAALPGVEQDAEGRQLASGELIVLQIFPRADGSESNVTVRGVTPESRWVRPEYEIVEGRDFEPGKSEIVVGRNLVERFPALALGEEVRFGRLDFRVVGAFTAGGSAAESEVWGAIEDIGNAFRRTNFVSSVRLRTSSPEAVAALVGQIENDPRYQVQVKSESEYYEEQTAANTFQFKALGMMLAALMGFGACFAAANTMFSQVANRAKEIGTLRALGFRRHHILGAFVLESAVLGVMGGFLGVLLATPLHGLSAGTTNFITFSEITFQLTLSPAVMLMGVALAVLTGVLGGLPPAWRASRRKIVELLRET
ncbi:MAG: ABC transporter permease [Holophagales bacterium]|nr:ABC transporter permease [Holophagales bacterium]